MFLNPFWAYITSLHICYVCIIILNVLYTYDTCDISTCIYIYKYDHSHMHVYNFMHIVFKVMTWICHNLIPTCICMDARTGTHTHTLDQCSMFVVLLFVTNTFLRVDVYLDCWWIVLFMCVTAVPSKKCYITLLGLQRKEIPFQHIDCFCFPTCWIYGVYSEAWVYVWVLTAKRWEAAKDEGRGLLSP